MEFGSKETLLDDGILINPSLDQYHQKLTTIESEVKKAKDKQDQ